MCFALFLIASLRFIVIRDSYFLAVLVAIIILILFPGFANFKLKFSQFIIGVFVLLIIVKLIFVMIPVTAAKS